MQIHLFFLLTLSISCHVVCLHQACVASVCGRQLLAGTDEPPSSRDGCGDGYRRLDGQPTAEEGESNVLRLTVHLTE